MLSLTVRWEDTAPASRGKWTEGADLCEALIAVSVTIYILQSRLLGCYSFFSVFFFLFLFFLIFFFLVLGYISLFNLFSCTLLVGKDNEEPPESLETRATG